MTAQTPALQNMMNSYVEQSKNLFSAFPFAPTGANEKSKS
jgi:hypothetical protein